MIRQCSRCYKSEYKKKEVTSLTNRDTDLQNLIKAQQPIKPIK